MPQHSHPLTQYRGSVSTLEKQCQKTSETVRNARKDYKTSLYRAVPRLKKLEEEMKLVQQEITNAHEKDETLKQSVKNVEIAEIESAKFLERMNNTYEDAVNDIQCNKKLSIEEKMNACREAETCYMSIMNHHEDVQNFQRLVQSARSNCKQSRELM